VTAEDGTTQQVYIITVHVYSNNASLSGFTVNGNTVAKGGVVNVANGTSSVTVVATPTSSKATAVVTGASNLQTGDNTITVTVTAEDGTTQVFTITVIVSESPLKCWLEGTLIQTPQGEILIEDLKAGDTVMTEDGRIVAIVSIQVTHRRNSSDAIVVPTDYFGPHIPNRPTYMTSYHAIRWQGTWVVPSFNNSALFSTVFLESAYFYHIELPSHEHDIILANNLPCECMFPPTAIVIPLFKPCIHPNTLNITTTVSFLATSCNENTSTDSATCCLEPSPALAPAQAPVLVRSLPLASISEINLVHEYIRENCMDKKLERRQCGKGGH
jgi:hypothetical protein